MEESHLLRIALVTFFIGLLSLFILYSFQKPLNQDKTVLLTENNLIEFTARVISVKNSSYGQNIILERTVEQKASFSGDLSSFSNQTLLFTGRLSGDYFEITSIQ